MSDVLLNLLVGLALLVAAVGIVVPILPGTLLGLAALLVLLSTWLVGRSDQALPQMAG